MAVCARACVHLKQHQSLWCTLVFVYFSVSLSITVNGQGVCVCVCVSAETDRSVGTVAFMEPTMPRRAINKTVRGSRGRQRLVPGWLVWPFPECVCLRMCV